MLTCGAVFGVATAMASRVKRTYPTLPDHAALCGIRPTRPEQERHCVLGTASPTGLVLMTAAPPEVMASAPPLGIEPWGDRRCCAVCLGSGQVVLA